VAGSVDPGAGAALSRAEPFMLGVRPEYIQVDDIGDGDERLPGAITGVVSQVQDIGTYWLLTAQVGAHTLKARLSAHARPPAPGATVALRVLNPHTCFYGADERLIATPATVARAQEGLA
jgi:glycerol transport system ATP-binding protein